MADELGAVSTAVADGAAGAGGDGTPADQGGAGGGAGTGDGAGAGGDGAQPGKTEEGGEGGAGEGGEGAGAGEGEGEGDEDLSPGDKIGEQISALKKTNPAAAKAWAKDHYHLKSYQEEFPSVQEARAAKSTLESLGGEEGITNLQTEVEDYRSEIEQFGNGDPELIRQLYDSNPEALVTAVQSSLDHIASANTRLFDQAIIPSLHARLESAGVYQAMTDLGKLIQEGNGQGAYDLLQNVGNWLTNLKSLAGQHKESRSQRNPERDELQAGREALAQERQKHIDSVIGSDVYRINGQSTAKVTAQFFRDIKLKSEGQKHFIDRLQSQIWTAMKKDKTFQRQANAIKSQGNNKRTVQFVTAKFEELLPGYFRQLRNALYPNYRPGKPAAASAKPNGSGGAAAGGAAAGGAGGAAKPAAAVSLQAGQRPAHDDVDWKKTSDMQWITGKNVTLRNGKVINIDWKSVKG